MNVIGDPHKVVAVFDAFLRYAREPSEGRSRVSTPSRPMERDEATPRRPTPLRPSAPPVSSYTRESSDAPRASFPKGGKTLPSVPPSEVVAEQFLADMTVLIKYGHAAQLPHEMDLWLRAHPHDLAAHCQLAEFEYARLDASAGLDRMFALATRALDRGESEIVRRVLSFVGRESPGDLRFAALRDRLPPR